MKEYSLLQRQAFPHRMQDLTNVNNLLTGFRRFSIIYG